MPPETGDEDADATRAWHGATEAEATDGTEAPQSIGRYRVIKTLGAGGMGSVYLAEDSELGRRVAIKLPRLDRDSDPSMNERFFREAKAAAGLSHPGICPVYDYGESEAGPYLAMAYVAGESLAERLRNNDVTADRLGNYFWNKNTFLSRKCQGTYAVCRTDLDR